jgi:hypothetical protein
MRVRKRLLRVVVLLSFLVINIVEPNGTGAAGSGWRRRQILLSDLGGGLEKSITPAFQTEEVLQQYLDSLDRTTAKRVIDGEFEHLVYYVLQSRYFTSLNPIEPALSARELFETQEALVRKRLLAEEPVDPATIVIPDRVRERLSAFLTAVGRSSTSREDREAHSARWRYFSTLIRTAKSTPRDRLRTEYLRTMRFLYRKEFLSRELEPEGQADYISALYRTRAHSTDTQVEAGFAVDTALALIRQMQDEGDQTRRFSRVLIIGPGQDLAPRTGLLDQLAPQSFQPFTLLDSLRRHGLDGPRGLKVHCLDINQRVVAHIDGLAGRAVRLDLVSGLTERLGWRFSADFREYFLNLGRSLGPVSDPSTRTSPGSTLFSPRLEGHLTSQVEVPAELSSHLSAEKLNIIAERYDPSPQFDLVVVTNVFPYFEVGRELPLAIANVAAMMATGGWLVHNEFSIIGNAAFDAAGLPVRQVRTLLIANGRGRPLYDGVVIHRKQQ